MYLTDISLEVLMVLEVGLLTIFTLFFSFSGLKSYIKDKFNEQYEKVISTTKKKDKLDTTSTIMNKYLQKMLNISTEMGRTFRLGIYLGILGIFILFIDEFFGHPTYYNSFSLLIFFYLIILIQLYALFLNVRRFKHLYELDMESMADFAYKRTEILYKALINKDIDLISSYERELIKNQDKWYKGLFEDVESIFKTNI